MSCSSRQVQTLDTVSPALRSALTGLNRDGAPRLNPALILSLPLLGSLSGEQAAWLAQRVAIRRLRRNEVLALQGEPDRAFHVVCTGSVHAVRQGRNGRSLLLDVLGPGGHFGERGLIDGQPRETTVRCAQATELLTVHGPDFRQCLAESPALRSALLCTLSRRLRARNQRIAMLALNDVHGCVVRQLHDASVEVQGQRIVHPPFTRQFVADRIGASREMVSRVFKARSRRCSPLCSQCGCWPWRWAGPRQSVSASPGTSAWWSGALQAATTALQVEAPEGQRQAGERKQRAQRMLAEVRSALDKTLAVSSLLTRSTPLSRQDVDLDFIVDLALGDLSDRQRARVQVRRQDSPRSADFEANPAPAAEPDHKRSKGAAKTSPTREFEHKGAGPGAARSTRRRSR